MVLHDFMLYKMGRVGRVTSYTWGEITPTISRVIYFTPVTYLFSAICKGYTFHPIYRTIVFRAHLVTLKNLEISKLYCIATKAVMLIRESLGYRS